MKLSFLGTADSAAIPVHNCQCKVCQAYREKEIINLATSAYIHYDNKVILLDAGVENISSYFDNTTIQAVFLTHFHPDHALGLLRLRYSEGGEIVCYHPQDDKGFADLFKHKKAIIYKQNIPFKAIQIDQLTFYPIPLKHSKSTTGYLIQSTDKTMAYLTDCAGIPQESMDFLKGFNLDYVFIDAGLAPESTNGNHLNYIEASSLLDEINPKKGYLFHASHQILEYLIDKKTILKYPYLSPEEVFNLKI